MAATLLDEDDGFDSLEAALCFLEECTEGTFTPLVPYEPSADPIGGGRVVPPFQLQVTKTSDDTRHETPLVAKEEEAEVATDRYARMGKEDKKMRIDPPKRNNRNRARDDRRREILYLRTKVQTMEQQLSELQISCGAESARLVRARGKNGTATTTCAWRDLAIRQYEQRTNAERENIHLKLRLRDQMRIAKSLEKILTGRAAMREIKACGLGSQSSYVHGSPTECSDAPIYVELLAGLEQSYREVDGVFFAIREGRKKIIHPHDIHMRNAQNGTFLETFPDKLLPFDTQLIANAVWDQFVYTMDRIPFRCYYQKEPRDTAEDTIADKVAVELQINKTKANFSYKQIFRRIVEPNRIIIVWRCVLELVAFAHEPLSGVHFHEKGYILIHKLASSGDSLLQTCYISTPEITNPMIKDNHERMRVLTDFVLRSTTETIHLSHQLIENELLDQALRSQNVEVV